MERKYLKVYKVSEDVVARKIEGEIVIVPIVSGVGSMDDDLYTLNTIGCEIWDRIDGRRSIVEIAENLGKAYDAPVEEIARDILELFSDLLSKGILVEA